MPKQRNKTQIRLFIIAILAIALFMLSLFEEHPKAIEAYYSSSLYLFVCQVMHPVFNIFPFSMGDILYILIIIAFLYFLFWLVLLLTRKKYRLVGASLLGLLVSILSGVLIFYVFWGLNYFRPSAGIRLNLRDTSYTTADLQEATCTIIDSTNACRSRITAQDIKQGNDSIFSVAVRAINKLSADSVKSSNFSSYHPAVKASLITPLLNYIGTSGYYNPFTTEAQINYQMPLFERSFVACHEMSHQMGYGPEDEANFVGFLAGIGSNDRLLRYSAYHEALDECMHALRRRDTLANNELKKAISNTVRNDFKAERTYWMSFRGKAGVLSSLFYDDYLKANNQPYGMDTYNQMVVLLVAWQKKQQH